MHQILHPEIAMSNFFLKHIVFSLLLAVGDSISDMTRVVVY